MKKLKLVAAHFGGYTEWEDSLKYLAGRNVWFDTSSSLWTLSFDLAHKIILKHGADKFVFGSDFPMWSHRGELNRFLSLKLSETENEKILYQNAKNLLNI